MSSTPHLLIHVLQDRLAALLGCGPEDRTALVAGMLKRNATESASYWLQLVVSIGIATLGLVLGSTAAVIGAMLVAPLMGPIVGLAMGLATGSPFLVLRSAGRVGLSVVIVVLGAAGITLLLPFHELNAEIAARTTPTALDLLTAAFCALAGVYATLRPGSDTTATAAGTSISISLVPPLCASGFGLGTSAWTVAAGAALLFLTNLVAIVVVGTFSFLASGFNRVAVAAIEHDELTRAGDAPLSRAIARRLSVLFESRGGPWFRVLMPFVLLGAVYVPLRSALNEVAWEVVVRAAAKTAISGLKQPLVQSRVRVDRHRVDVAVVVLGKSSDVEAARHQLEREIAAIAKVTPHVEVLAIPDAEAFAGLESTIRAPIAQPELKVSPAESLDKSREFVRASLRKYWPEDSAGPILSTELGLDGTPVVVTVVHFGAVLANSALEVLDHSLEQEIGKSVRVVASAIPSTPISRTDDDFLFVAQLSSALRAAEGVDELSVCATRPPDPPAWRPSSVHEKAFSKSVLVLLQSRKLAVVTTANEWQVLFVRGSCPQPQDGGIPDAKASPTDAGRD